MSKAMFVKPAQGRRVRDPADGTVLPAEGREVTGNSLFWKQRLRDGDVLDIATAATPKAPRTAAKEV